MVPDQATPLPGTYLVKPLDGQVIERLTLVLRKIKHDLSNNLVATMGELELLAEEAPNRQQAEKIQAARNKLLRPFDDLRRLLLPFPQADGARLSGTEVMKQLNSRASMLGVQLNWPQPVVHLLTEDPELAAVVAALTTNALDAAIPQQPLQVRVTLEGQKLSVIDNGQGCGDVQAAALGQLVRMGGAHLGVGLGLAAKALTDRGGTLTLEANSPRGLRAVATWTRTGSADGVLA